jgi:hypothetical protein
MIADRHGVTPDDQDLIDEIEDQKNARPWGYFDPMIHPQYGIEAYEPTPRPIYSYHLGSNGKYVCINPDGHVDAAYFEEILAIRFCANKNKETSR